MRERLKHEWALWVGRCHFLRRRSAVYRVGWLIWVACGVGGIAWGEEWSVGLAREEITPQTAIRLTGYASRKTPSVGVAQPLWAKAMSVRVGTQGGERVVLVTLDLCGISDGTMRLIWDGVQKKFGVGSERCVLSCSHTHSGPCTTGWAPNIFAGDIPEADRLVLEAYTREMVGKVIGVVGRAVADEKPGVVEWAEGTVGFARNRRTPGGPVDHALPVLRVRGEDGRLRALVANYACHCTTLGSELNQVSGDWAGYAQAFMELDHPGAMAMITVGCGADSNPLPRGGSDLGLTFVRQYGGMIATEVRRLMGLEFKVLTAKPRVAQRMLELPFQSGWTRAQWEERSAKPGIVGYHAKKNLSRLDRGEVIPTRLDYPVTTWCFGEELSMVFLPGEVVVDYVHRIRSEHPGRRLWVTAYANYVPCYIPSKRVLAEGGYEAEDSLWYYDRAQRLAPEVEDLITTAVGEMIRE